ncbi:MAG: TonB-dependent receptor, partial [Acidobacteria bacterium]|nr:TonB-dependent receptor [Acidobacteriota bacterium]
MLPRFAASRAAATAVFLALATAHASAAQPADVVLGRVTDGFGDPLPGAAVEAISPSGYVSAVRTGGAGRYELPPLVAGAYRLTFSHDGYAEQSVAVEVAAGATTRLAVSLQPLIPTRIAGAVVDQQGLALPGALVEAAAADAPPVTATTDAAGRFAFGPLRPGRWRLAVTMPGFAGAEIAVDVAFSEQADLRVPLALDYALREEIVVVGSRRRVKQRTVLDSPVPVDVLTARELASQPRTDMADLMRALAPSFNVTRQPVADGAAFVRPVTLRNLSPDHLLVLVNGKRRHRSPMLAWLGPGLAQGSQGPDVSTIPAIALRQVELLRDGAAAQYGSDAIGGVVNFELADAREGGAVHLTTGTLLTGNDGDPATCGASFSCDGLGGRAGQRAIAANAGLPVGASGFANLSIEYGGSQPTNRAVQTDEAAAVAGARDTAYVWGRPRLSDDLKTFVNMALPPLPRFELTPYAHGGYAERRLSSAFYYRSPHSPHTLGVYRYPYGLADAPPNADSLLLVGREPGGAPCPQVPLDADGRPAPAALRALRATPGCFSMLDTYPGGFSPHFSGLLRDVSGVAGIRHIAPSGFAWDASANVGRSSLAMDLSHTLNPSFGVPGAQGPIRLGDTRQDEVSLNFDLALPLGPSWHAMAGAEWRREQYRVGAGEELAWDAGPYAQQGFAAGAHGFPAHHPRLAAGAPPQARANLSAYGELEYLHEAGHSAAGAIRAEDFSIVDSIDGRDAADWLTVNVKGAGRLALGGSLSVRGGVSTGFRAPTPAQQYTFAVTNNFIDLADERLGGRGALTRLILGSTSIPQAAVRTFLRASSSYLEPERSRHVSAGAVASPGNRTQFGADFFDVRVRDRLAFSPQYALGHVVLQ